MSGNTTFYDFGSMQQSPRHSISTTSSGGRHSIFDAPEVYNTPLTTPPSSEFKPQRSEHTTTINFRPLLGVNFTKGTNLFKLKFGRVDIVRDAGGGLRCLELSESSTSGLIHAFPNGRMPIPHLEQPYVGSSSSTFRISFLDEQTVQTAGNLFATKPSYTFEKWESCLQFQEALLQQSVIFCAGLAEAKSKRGEECISQNLRVLRARNRRQIIIFFANSQRKEKRKYVSIPLDAIDQIDPGKKNSRPVVMKLSTDNELTTAMKALSVQFLDETDHLRFVAVLQQGCGPHSR
jgi:hypothetical protein